MATISPQLESLALDHTLSKSKSTSSDANSDKTFSAKPILPAAHRIPAEILRLIFNYTADYELVSTLHVPHDLEMTAPWAEQSTPLDRAILSSSLRLVSDLYFGHGHTTFSHWGARIILRFGYLYMLDFFLKNEPEQLRKICSFLLPVLASAWGRVSVLEWAVAKGGQFKFDQDSVQEAMDEASRHGHVDVLTWWKERSGYKLEYSENALSSATIKRQIPVLEWWRDSGLPLKIGYVLDFASMEGSQVALDWWATNSRLHPSHSKTALYHLSCVGNVDSLNWWRDSKFKMLYDKDVIIGATKHGQTQALEWWIDSGLEITYRPFDIEEALEDAINDAARERSQNWWRRHGLSGSSRATEMMRIFKLC